MSIVPSVNQRERAKKGVREQQNRCEFMNFLYDRSGRHDLPKGTHPHATFTGLADEFALELGRDLVKDFSSKWHIKNVREGLEVRDNKNKLLLELENEIKN